MKSIINELWHGNIIPQEDIDNAMCRKMDDFIGGLDDETVLAAVDTICWWYIPSRDLHAFINKIVLKIKSTKPSKILYYAPLRELLLDVLFVECQQ